MTDMLDINIAMCLSLMRDLGQHRSRLGVKSKPMVVIGSKDCIVRGLT